METEVPAEHKTGDGAVDYQNFPEEAIFADSAKSEGGKLISLTGDTWGENEEVVAAIRWTDKEEGIKNGLTMVLKSSWYTKGANGMVRA